MATIDYKQKIKDYMNSSEIDALYKSMLNNLFPELAESEDKRIRKAIINIIGDIDGGFKFEKYGILKKDALAWLEKEAKGNDREIPNSEQKPAVWSDEDEEMLKSIKYHLDCDNADIRCYGWLEELKDRVQPQPKQEWSEEDEKFVHGLIRGLSAKRDIHGHTTFSSDLSMSNLIEKSALLAEIDRLVNNYDKALDYEAALEDVRDFIDNYESKEVDSQVNSQVKESAETQHVNDMCKENGNSLTQEPVSEDLMDATNNYCVNVRKGYPRVMDETDRYICNAFKAGAKWQETKDKQILNEEGVMILPEEEFERMKRSLIKLSEREQQMMAKAIDGVVTFDYYEGDKAYGCVAHDSFCLEDLGLKDKDEVKILILKK